MRNLHDLPTEVVDLIFDHLQPVDLELIRACCQRFRILAEPHRLKQCLSDLELDCGRGERIYRTPLFILCAAISDSRVRRYAKRLKFSRCRSHDCLESHMSNSFVSSLQLFVLEDSYGGWERYDEVYQKLRTGDQDVTFAMLLVILDNVSELVLDDWPGTFTKGQIEYTPNGLSHISKVRSSCSSIFTTFAQLPSVRILEGTVIIRFGDDFARSRPSSNVHSICIDRGIIQPEYFSAFLSAFKSLRKFTYTASPYSIWSPNAIVAALLEHASISLEVLDIGCQRSLRIRPAALFIGSLQGFKRLRHVGLDIEMLLLDGFAQKLIDVLPASVETLQLRHKLKAPGWPDVTGSGIIAYLFSDLLELKEDLLPNFRKIVSSKPIKRFFKVPIEEAGIVVEVPYYDEK